MNKFISFQVLMAMLFFAITGCNKDKPESEPDPAGPIEVKFQANIKPPSLLKLANDQFDNYDRIEVFMKRSERPFSAPGRIHSTLWMEEATGIFRPSPALLFPPEGNVDFIAVYSPLGQNYSEDFIYVGIYDEILYSNNAVDIAPTTDPVALEFKYALAKLQITVSGGANSKLAAADFSAMSASIDEMYTFAQLHLKDETYAGHEHKMSVPLRKIGSTANSATFETLMLPRSASDGTFTFVFNVGDAAYRYTYTPEYLAANLYQLNFSLDFPTPALFSTTVTPRIVNEPQNFSVSAYEPEMYVASSGAGELLLFLNGTGTVSVDWGDGWEPETSTLSGNFIKFSHEYEYEDAAPRKATISGYNITEFEYAISNGGNIQNIVLDASHNKTLRRLYCNGARLTSLDVSGCTALQELGCPDNQLSSVKLGNNPVLWIINFNRNQLTSLDVSECTALMWLDCGRNPLDAAALNALFGTLHSNPPGDKSMIIDYTPGVGACDRSIATAKGWDVLD